LLLDDDFGGTTAELWKNSPIQQIQTEFVRKVKTANPIKID